MESTNLLKYELGGTYNNGKKTQNNQRQDQIHGWQPTKLHLYQINEQKRPEKREDVPSLFLLCQRHEEFQQYTYQHPQDCAQTLTQIYPQLDGRDSYQADDN